MEIICVVRKNILPTLLFLAPPLCAHAHCSYRTKMGKGDMMLSLLFNTTECLKIKIICVAGNFFYKDRKETISIYMNLTFKLFEAIMHKKNIISALASVSRWLKGFSKMTSTYLKSKHMHRWIMSTC